jgi:hypothetical protein
MAHKTAVPPLIRPDANFSNLYIANQTISNQTIEIINPPVNPKDATNKEYVDTVVGDLPGSPVTSIQFNNGGVFGGSSDLTWNDTTKVLSALKMKVIDPPINPTDVTNKAYVDAAMGNPPGLPFNSVQFNDGGVFGGSVDLIWDDTTKVLNSSTGTFSALKMTVINPPTAASDLANKAYVDAATGSSPVGPSNALQFNNSGIFGGSGDLLWNDTTKILTVNGLVVAQDHMSISDKTLKKNILKIDGENCLGILSKIECFKYNLLDSDKETYGVMAQQLEEIGLGNLINNDNDYKTVSYIQIITLLISSLKLLNEKLNSVEQTIEKNKKKKKKGQ